MFEQLLRALKEAKISLNDKQAVKKIKSIIVDLDFDVLDFEIDIHWCQGHQICQIDYIETNDEFTTIKNFLTAVYPIISCMDNTENSELEETDEG